MKTRISIYLALIVSAFVLTACPEADIDKLLETEGPIEYTKTFSMDLQEGDSLLKYQADRFSTSYKGIKITDVKINSMTGTYTNIENPNNEKVTFMFGFNGVPGRATGISNQVISENFEGQSQDLLQFAQAEISKYERHLVENPEATIETYYEFSGAPVKFDFKLVLNATVTGTPE